MSYRTVTMAENEQLLWAQFQEGDPAAFGCLIRKYYRPLFQYSTRFTRDRAQIEDCIQDCFLYLWEHRQGLSVPVSVKLYLLKSLRNRLLLEIKKASGTATSTLSEADAETDNVEQWLIQEETGLEHLQRLKHLVARLPERQREALYLKYFEDLSNDQIAQVMGINRQSAANFLFRALGALREHWYQLPALLVCFFY
ncbi:RNA polymerase sigma factor [Larkinella soli]|uniref:RNA polymerase sigma factor n=1 Tax=Larkinella soli TaxID=1770527 RepID=UPI000FFC01D4|nr:sigma-70 family RNA polymerase sigma factor [Larkinella soli]